MSEEAGYVISRAGLRKLAAAIKDDIEACKTSDSHTEQVISKLYCYILYIISCKLWLQLLRRSRNKVKDL